MRPSRVRQGVRDRLVAHDPQAHAQRGQALRVLVLRQGLRRGKQPDETHQDAHRRAAVQVLASRMQQALRAPGPAEATPGRASRQGDARGVNGVRRGQIESVAVPSSSPFYIPRHLPSTSLNTSSPSSPLSHPHSSPDNTKRLRSHPTPQSTFKSTLRSTTSTNTSAPTSCTVDLYIIPPDFVCIA